MFFKDKRPGNNHLFRLIHHRKNNSHKIAPKAANIDIETSLENVDLPIMLNKVTKKISPIIFIKFFILYFSGINFIYHSIFF